MSNFIELPVYCRGCNRKAHSIAQLSGWLQVSVIGAGRLVITHDLNCLRQVLAASTQAEIDIIADTHELATAAQLEALVHG